MFNFRSGASAASICTAMIATALAGCAATPAKSGAVAAAPPSAAVVALYARLDADEKKYFAAREPETYNKDTAAATALYKAAWDDAQDAQALCAKTHGCDGAKFDAAFARMGGAASAPSEADNSSAPT